MKNLIPRVGLKGLWRVTSLLLLSVGAVAAVGQTGMSLPLPSPVRSVSLPSAFTVNADLSTTIVSNGYAVSHAWIVYPGKPESIYLTSLKSGQQTNLSLPGWLDAGSVIRLEAVSLTPSGQVVLAGTSLRSTETDDINNFVASPTYFERTVKGVDVHNFVAEIDMQGNTISQIDLGTYTPERVCTAADGTLWTLGQIWAQEPLNPKLRSGDYSLLRRYNAAGKLVGSYLPQSSILGKEFMRDYHENSRSPAFLICGNDSVAVYLSAAPLISSVWAEVVLQSGEYSQVLVRTPRQMEATGLALLGTNAGYASFAPSMRGGVFPAKWGHLPPGPAGLYRLVLGPQYAEWQPIQPADQTELISRLLGHDGTYLVHLEATGAGLDSPPTVYWTSPSN